MSHYYDFDPSLQSKPKQIQTYIGNEKFTFLTDIGVFSKD
ncbi:MAG TPA: class I SAM-dependent methyltransferase, partial [Candidatus Caccosoma faecigallinarum]|nr:class I SAM-dependent methyltransferase [Candidatus Caccosoma faecigallinarum]